MLNGPTVLWAPGSLTAAGAFKRAPGIERLPNRSMDTARGHGADPAKEDRPAVSWASPFPADHGAAAPVPPYPRFPAGWLDWLMYG